MHSATPSEAQEKPKDIPRFWLKIYNDVQTDIRFITMSHEHQGIYFNLLVLANNPFTVGRVVGSREDLARGLRISGQKLDKALQEFESKSLVFVEGSTIEIADERHYTGVGLTPSDSREAKAERMRVHRARVKAAEMQRQREEVARDSNASPARADQSNVEADGDSESDENKFSCHQEEVRTTTNYPDGWDGSAEDPPYPLAIDDDIPLL